MTRQGIKGVFALAFSILAAGAAVGLFGSGCTINVLPDTLPDFASARFTDPSTIDNPYFPRTPGTTWTYEADTEDGLEEIVVEALDDTREVMGVSCRVVRDRVCLDGVLIEDTHDWFAQDDDGNVWYMGETVDNYNYDDDGNLIDVTHEDAWEAGEDVAGLGVMAQPGYAMKASPMIGDVYHQEYYRGEAEDMAEVMALNVEVMLENGESYSCLETLDSTVLDSTAQEYKYYAPGVGPVVEEAVDGSQRVELVSVE